MSPVPANQEVTDPRGDDLALFLAIYWISVPAWTFLDARDRGETAWIWGAFTVIGNVIALVAYLLA